MTFIYEPEAQQQYDKEIAIVADPRVLEQKLKLEQRDMNFFRNMRYVLNFGTAGLLTAPLLQYAINIFDVPDGARAIFAGFIAIYTTPVAIVYYLHGRSVKRAEKEFQRRVSMLEAKLQ